ncbi:mitochondrial fission ELM1-domain-containing protein [Pilobolus umbonatus]|nr:mitochondrial fission ELM1-domain-containing protein [Pilobolus umbonatus]
MSIIKQIYKQSNNILLTRQYTTKVSHVWVITDGGIENTLRGMALGKQLSGTARLSNTFKLKKVVASKTLQMFPVIIQKYLTEWCASKHKGQSLKSLPWCLSSSKEYLDDSDPDYIIASGQDSVPACIYTSKTSNNKKCFTVYLGYPGIPFINFDQVILPKYEANVKMATLGPLARQKNGIITPAPLLDTLPLDFEGAQIKDIIPPSFKDGFTSVIIGGHSPNCRWYSEDAVHFAANIKRMIDHFDDKVMVVFTERTPEMVKNKFTKKVTEGLPNHANSIQFWDSMKEDSKLIDKMMTYEAIIHRSKRVILTADLDYASAHAISKDKPVYMVFGGETRSYISHFYRWVIESHLARKFRIDRAKNRSAKVDDPYSYLGKHKPWGNSARIFHMKDTMKYVKHEIEANRAEKVTGKRRSDV